MAKERNANFEAMKTRKTVWAFFILTVLTQMTCVKCLYFPMPTVNLSLPISMTNSTSSIPLIKLRVLPESKKQNLMENVSYTITSETVAGCVVLDGNNVKLNEKFFSATDLVIPRRQTVVVTAALPHSKDVAKITLNLSFAKGQWDCENFKTNLCFWNEASFQIYESDGSQQLGPMSSDLYWKICKNYFVEYSIVGGSGYIEMQKSKEKSWLLSSTKKVKGSVSKQIRFAVNCTVNWAKGSENIYKNFDLTILGKEKLQIYVNNQRRQSSSNIIYPSIQNIIIEPIMLNSEKSAAPPPLAKAEETLILYLKYPDSVEISKKAVVGTRVAEPFSSTGLHQTEVRRKMVAAKIQFQMLTPGAFNVTANGGIVFVSNRQLLKDNFYRLKITATHSHGHKFFYSVRINVTDTKVTSSGALEICGKSTNDSWRISCSEKRSKIECAKTCGVGSGILKRTEKSDPPVTVGCSWRSNGNPQKLSKVYQTCSPDLLTCPDRFCDPLEAVFPKICPQDCTEYVFGSANKEKHLPGIASATGVCGCDNRQKCLCSLVNNIEPSPKQSDRRKFKEVINDTILARQREAISAEKAARTDSCGPMCFLFIIGGGIIFIFGTFTFLLMNYRRRVKKRCLNQEPHKEDVIIINYEDYVERQRDGIRPLAQTTTVKEIPEYYDKKWEFPRYRLTIEETIGEGEFGKVLKARADGINGNTGSMTVAVKTLKDNVKDSELADLISEYQLLKEIDHPNVIHLLGACTKLDGPVYIIIEYAKHGSLRNYLRQHRYITYEEINTKDDTTIRNQLVTPKDILTFAWQIAKGMNYLTDMKLVHRDLAARNVLVAEGLICKISDFGLTRDIYEDDTYLKRSKGRVPVKWMALESLADHIYTTKSDVWSYGIVLWELVTTGASPYPGIAGQNIFHLLKSGYRMEKPPNCSVELYQILRSCWRENPSHRPTFKSLVLKFEEMLAEGKDYLDLNPRTVENKTYFSEFLNDDDEVEISAVGSCLPEDRNEFLDLKFEMFNKSVDYIKCQNAKSINENGPNYENEKIILKPKYENDRMEDSGYVLPTGQPKPV